jgi:hypothetical protein
MKLRGVWPHTGHGERIPWSTAYHSHWEIYTILAQSRNCRCVTLNGANIVKQKLRMVINAAAIEELDGTGQ